MQYPQGSVGAEKPEVDWDKPATKTKAGNCRAGCSKPFLAVDRGSLVERFRLMHLRALEVAQWPRNWGTVADR